MWNSWSSHLIVLKRSSPDISHLNGIDCIWNCNDCLKWWLWNEKWDFENYFSTPDLKFLYSYFLYFPDTTPPKNVLEPTKTLADYECVPCAILYFGTDKSVPDTYKYLRGDLFQRFISPSIASIAASKLM